MVFIDVYKIIGVYCLVLAILGTICNFLIFTTCLLRLRKHCTFIFIMFLSVSDCLSLYSWNLTHFTDAFFDSSFMYESMFSCKFMCFLQYASLHCSAWLMVTMAYERFLSVYFRQWRLAYFKSKQALATCIAMVSVIVLVNSNVLFTFGYVKYDENGTYISTVCWEISGVPSTQWMTTWNTVHSFIYSYVPFCLLAIANCLLIFTLHRQRKASHITQSAQHVRKQKAMTITIIVITLLFILFTGTGAVVNFFVNDLMQTYIGNIIMALGDALCFTFHGLNIISLILSNRKFRDEFYEMLYIRRSKEGNASTGHNSTLDRLALNDLKSGNSKL